MPTTPRRALRYPSGTSPADVPTDLQNLALDVDNSFPRRMAAGTVVIVIPSGSTNATQAIDVTATGFSAAPVVVASTGVSTHFGHSGPRTSTSITVGATHRDPTATSGGNVTVHWWAVEM
jgi:hypothetical protein